MPWKPWKDLANKNRQLGQRNCSTESTGTKKQKGQEVPVEGRRQRRPGRLDGVLVGVVGRCLGHLEEADAKFVDVVDFAAVSQPRASVLIVVLELGQPDQRQGHLGRPTRIRSIT